MFTKDKKRAGEKKSVPQKRPAAPSEAAAGRKQPEPPRRRPAEAGTDRPSRKAAPERRPQEAEKRAVPQEKRRRMPEEPRKKKTEIPGRKPAPVGKNAQEQPRRLPVRKPAPEQNRPETAVNPQAQTEDQVFQIPQAPRQTPVTSRTAPRQAVRKPAAGKEATRKRKVKKSGPPQGTSYHRSSPRPKKSLMDMVREKTANPYADPDEQAAAARARQASRAAQKQKLQKIASKLDAPAIVYTQPKPFNRNRLLIQMISVLAVASSFVLALSIFFKVETITVSGADTYSPYKIEEASGIHKGDYLLTFGRARACGQITAKLPYVKSVRIGIKLPNTVNIDVQEAAVVYSIRSGDGDWWLITSEGKVVQQIPGTTSGGYTTVLGVQIENPVPGEEATALEAVPEVTEATQAGEGQEEKKDENSLLEPPVVVSANMRLKSALRILTALEDNDIVGDAATVNVENIEKIELWYGQKYQVNLGSTEQLEYKVACMYDAILQMSEYQNGMLDVSFTKKKDQVIYTPFV